MTRPIKFRAWDTISGKYAYAIPDVTQTILEWDNSNGSLRLQQFTGLLDKNGKEIYEGDIVRYHHYYDNFGTIEEDEYRNGVVVWGDETAMHGGWHVRERRKYDNGYINEESDERFPNVKTDKPISKIEVIGNIYENKELLK